MAPHTSVLQRRVGSTSKRKWIIVLRTLRSGCALAGQGQTLKGQIGAPGAGSERHNFTLSFIPNRGHSLIVFSLCTYLAITDMLPTEDIVVAVDGSLTSRQAAEWAASVLLEPGILYLMNVRGLRPA